MDQPALARLGRAALPIVALLVFAAVVGGRRLGAPAALGLPYRREER